MLSRLITTLQGRLARWRERGFLHLAAALLFEALLFGFLAFLLLYTLELLLPTFVSARFPLMEMLFILLLGIALYLSLERFLNLQPRIGRTTVSSVWVKVMAVFASLWGLGLFFISLAKFPLWSFPFLAALAAAALSLGWRAWQGK